MMKYSEQFMEHIEYTFAAFCNVVLHNAAINAYRDFGRKQKREVSLDYLMSETSLEPFTMDRYFEQYDKPTVFVVKEQEIIVASERLADALSRLPEQRRTVLLMYFFLGYTDTKIGNEYGRSRSTVNYWKLAALKQLRKKWRKQNMRNKKLIPFEVIEKAVAGEPEAIDAVLQHYTPRIKHLSMYQGRINDEIQDRLKAQLIHAIFQFRFDR